MANPKEITPDKYEYIFEDEQAVSVWKYDSSKTKGGPVSVEYRWKASFLKEVEAIRKVERDAKKKKKPAKPKKVVVLNPKKTVKSKVEIKLPEVVPTKTVKPKVTPVAVIPKKTPKPKLSAKEKKQLKMDKFDKKFWE